MLFKDNFPGATNIQDYMQIPIKGCTFSGDPYTSFRNTVASLIYSYSEAVYVGISEPWKISRDFFCMATGDDRVLWSRIDLLSGIDALNSETKTGIKGNG